MACLNTRDNANLKRLALRLISQDSKLKETNYETTTVHEALFLGQRKAVPYAAEIQGSALCDIE